jgi:hypothetical protein
MQGKKSHFFQRIRYRMPHSLKNLLVTVLEVRATGVHAQR